MSRQDSAGVLRWLESLVQDLRFGARMLWKDRAAMAAAVISLALALGACSTAFSLIDALILRPLPVAHPDQLFFLTYPDSLAKSQPGVRREHDTFSYPQYQSFRQAADPISTFSRSASPGPSRRPDSPLSAAKKNRAAWKASPGSGSAC